MRRSKLENREKGTVEPTDEAEKDGWLDTIRILHEFLPEDFPEIKPVGEDHRMRTEHEIGISLDRDGNLRVVPTQIDFERISIQYRLLAIFLEDFKGDPNEPFYFANLPFKFIASTFVKQYAEKVTKQQMRIILKSLGLKKETIKGCLRDFSSEFKKEDADQFISGFLAYVSTKQNLKRYRFSFAEIMENLKISEDQLKDFAIDFKIDKSGISIFVSKKLIIYEPNLPKDE